MYVDAVRTYNKPLSLARGFKRKKFELDCLCALGEWQALLGESDNARVNLNSCLSLSTELNLPLERGRSLASLGDLERTLGNNDLARQHYAEARGLYQKEGNRLGEANVLGGLGELERTLGNNDLARQDY